MKKIYNYLFIIAVSLNVAQAQTDAGFFHTAGTAAPMIFATDYMANGINPSNLGWKSKRKFHIAIASFGVSAFSEGFNRSQFSKNPIDYFSGDLELTKEEKELATNTFTNSGTTIDLDVNLLSLALQLPKFGGLAFNIRESLGFYAKLNPTFTDILFNGFNAAYFDSLDINVNGDTIGISRNPKPISEILDGSDIRMSWIREFNLSYGKRIFDNDDMEVFIGIGLKYLHGMGVASIQAEDGELSGYFGLTPLFTPEFNQNNLDDTSKIDFESGYVPIGNGIGVDIGTSFIIKEKITLGFAINNLGAINWKANLVTLNDNILTQTASDGVTSLNLVTGNDFVNDSAIKWKVDSERNIALPASMSFGAGYKFNKNFEAGIDAFFPLNQTTGNIVSPIIGLGGKAKIAKEFVQLSSGLIYGENYGLNIPLGIAFSIKGIYEFGFASRDIITFIGGNNPRLSLVTGFLRFGFF